MNSMAEMIPQATIPVAADKLLADLRILAADMEQLLQATASQTGREALAARERAMASLAAIRTRVAGLQDAALVRTRAAGRATDEYAHANPWQVMAIGAAAGLAIGVLLARCGSTEA